MKIIGLTGGIASGKSTVARMLREAGLPVIDADQVAREIVEPGEPALQEIFDAFGHELRLDDGTLDRKALGQIVFSDPEKLQQLNQITHPRVALRVQQKMAALAEQGHPLSVYEVPLLFENGLQDAMDQVILVALDQESQIQRLCQRNEITRREALDRIQSQMPLQQKRTLADYIIENHGDLDALSAQVHALIQTLSRP